MSDNIRDFPRIARLDKYEIADLISLLVQYEGRAHLVRDDFRYLHDKKISLRTVRAVALKFEEDIQKKSKELLAEQALNPLASRSYRYKLLWGIFKRASQLKARGVKRTSKDEWVSDIKDDPATQLRVLDLAERMDVGPEGLAIKRAQLADGVEVGTDEGDDFEMDDGLSVG